MKKIASIFAAAALAFGAYAASPETVSYTLNPPMSCENCVNRVSENLRFEKGVKDLNISLADQLVTVTYDPEKTTSANLEKALSKIGYKATKIGKEGKTGKKAKEAKGAKTAEAAHECTGQCGGHHHEKKAAPLVKKQAK